MNKFQLGDRVRYQGHTTEYEIVWMHSPSEHAVDLKLVKYNPKYNPSFVGHKYPLGYIFAYTSTFSLELVTKKKKANHPLTNIFK